MQKNIDRLYGERTGPTATLLVFILEYVKLWLPWRPSRIVAHGVLGWLLFPFRYPDLILFRWPRAAETSTKNLSASAVNHFSLPRVNRPLSLPQPDRA